MYYFYFLYIKAARDALLGTSILVMGKKVVTCAPREFAMMAFYWKNGKGIEKLCFPAFYKGFGKFKYDYHTFVVLKHFYNRYMLRV